MTNKGFSWLNIFSEFESREIDIEELENIIEEAVIKEHPGDTIKKFEYTENGIEIIMKSGREIEIEIDWNEIVLS